MSELLSPPSTNYRRDNPGPQNNPYNSLHLSQSDLIIAQQYIKWEQGNWSKLDQDLLIVKIKQCIIRKDLHWTMARNCATKGKLINIPKIIISTILASSLTFTSNNSLYTNLLYYFNVSTSVVLAVLTTTSSFLNYDVQKICHRNSSLGYSKLAAHMDRLMRLPQDERESFGETLFQINKQYTDLASNAPFIKPDIIATYKKIHEKENYSEDPGPVEVKQELNDIAISSTYKCAAFRPIPIRRVTPTPPRSLTPPPPSRFTSTSRPTSPTNV